MSTPNHPLTENTLQKEQRLYRELFDRFMNAILNRLFDLSSSSAAWRSRMLTMLFLLTGFLITLYHYPLNLWTQRLQEIFLYLLNPAYAAGYTGEPFTPFLTLIEQALFDPHILQYLPIFLAPFFIALHLAGLYLADIFELQDVTVARSFVSSVALSGSEETIRVKEGQVTEKSQESPTFLIGGPGKVMVDLDSVALFEKADGTPHVIGPTGREPIDGFERFRQAIDIRDHYVELRDQDSKSPSVKGRSRDGIPITATDVRLMFSIHRGEHEQTKAEFPYTFSKEAVERIVYRSTSRVTPDQTNPSAYEFSWINNMVGLIRGRLGGFMSERNLTEYLASTGLPEFEKSKQREETIAEQVRRLTQPTDEENSDKAIKPPQQNFTPRYKITNLFSQFTEDFTKNARNNGVELHWIGVGTWKTPPEIEIVSEKHLEAWKLSQDNLRNGSQGAMNAAENNAILNKIAALIQHGPVQAFHEIVGSSKRSYAPTRKTQSNKKQDYSKPKDIDTDYDNDVLFEDVDLIEIFNENLTLPDLAKRFNERIVAATELQKYKEYKEIETSPEHRDGMRVLLLEYRKELLEAVQFMKAKNETIPPIIEEAIKYINVQMGFKHWAGLT